MPTRAALFDFDGTLADSFAGITASTNHVRQLYGLPAMTVDEVGIYVGLGLANLLETVVPNAPTSEAIAAYKAHHLGVMVAGTQLLPGVLDTLTQLHQGGIALAICSNKAVAFTKQIVSSLGIAPLFQAVLGPDDVAGRAKPHPDMLLEGLTRLGVSRSETVYVGDMAVDVHAGKAAGVTVWLVEGGAAGRESAREAGPDRVLTDFTELVPLLLPKD